ncbi:GNAT family N-acetyltransferase [bacterium]|nr:GNAT family N-acetyltransferase [candidate division CSSED10-310 bacterium]
MLKTAGETIGTCSNEHLEGKLTGEIGFDLAKRHWGHGYMMEELLAVIEYGFVCLGLAQITADTYSDYPRARRVFDKVGFRVASVGEDSHCYSVSREDWIRDRCRGQRVSGPGFPEP